MYCVLTVYVCVYLYVCVYCVRVSVFTSQPSWIGSERFWVLHPPPPHPPSPKLLLYLIFSLLFVYSPSCICSFQQQEKEVSRDLWGSHHWIAPNLWENLLNVFGFCMILHCLIDFLFRFLHNTNKC
ncbi:hypothetical protein GDO81_011492 [Engystomops pustulosus]|uniref:Uncharacterized protein n=1 Tax=Engystomops pustulosus TaxID=76066 RepID=A0AAV7BEF9_ENGPU|nr:hypothetical protein GDO81_011492 [Engystomops pustulosus]